MSKFAPFGDGFNAEAYWGQFEAKKWVVTVEGGMRLVKIGDAWKRQRQTETLYVRAKTKEGAITTAKRHANVRGQFYARLAHPRDLGCEPVPQARGSHVDL